MRGTRGMSSRQLPTPSILTSLADGWLVSVKCDTLPFIIKQYHLWQPVLYRRYGLCIISHNPRREPFHYCTPLLLYQNNTLQCHYTCTWAQPIYCVGGGWEKGRTKAVGKKSRQEFTAREIEYDGIKTQAIN